MYLSWREVPQDFDDWILFRFRFRRVCTAMNQTPVLQERNNYSSTAAGTVEEEISRSWSLAVPPRRLEIRPRVFSNSPSRYTRLSTQFGSYWQFNPSIPSWTVIKYDTKNVNASRSDNKWDIRRPCSARQWLYFFL